MPESHHHGFTEPPVITNHQEYYVELYGEQRGIEHRAKKFISNPKVQSLIKDTKETERDSHGLVKGKTTNNFNGPISRTFPTDSEE